MNIKTITLTGSALITLLAGCASNPIAVAPVGPAPVSHAAFLPTGSLQVFSDTETRQIGDNSPYYPHTGYSIHDESGKIVRYVSNHTGDMDESPSKVTIPAGHYSIVAESSSYGRVTVPVVIEQGKATVIHLDGNWQPSAKIASTDLVYLPNGEAVGWK